MEEISLFILYKMSHFKRFWTSLETFIFLGFILFVSSVVVQTHLIGFVVYINGKNSKIKRTLGILKYTSMIEEFQQLLVHQTIHSVLNSQFVIFS